MSLSPIIITPDHPDFWVTLHSAPPPSALQTSAFCVVDHESYSLRWVTEEELVDYTMGGEQEYVEAQWGDEETGDLVFL
jgi:hypothetical protein